MSVNNNTNVINNRNYGGLQINAPIGGRTREEKRKKIRDRLLAKIDENKKPENPMQGTCEWVDQDIDSWLKDPKDHLLWIFGGPGKGKTNIATHIIKNLKSISPTGEAIVLSFFCENGNSRLSTAQAVLLSFLHQLLRANRSNNPLHDDVAAQMDNGQKNLYNNVPDIGFWNVLKERIRPPEDNSPTAKGQPGSQQVLIVLDGLDECDPDSIDFLTKQFMDICHPNIKGDVMCKAIIVSRPLPIILGTFNRKIDLDSDHYRKKTLEDIELFIKCRAPPVFSENGQLGKLTGILSKRSSGLFLWVSLAVEMLGRDEAAIKQIVDGNGQRLLETLFPAGLNAMYNRALREALCGKQISGDCFQPEDAMIVIRCISMACRPLSKNELFIATGLSEPEISAHITNCRHILAPMKNASEDETPGDEILQLVHFSLKEYLQHEVNVFMSIHSSIARRMWRPLRSVTDWMRVKSYQFFLFDHLLIAITLLHARGFLSQHPTLVLLAVVLCIYMLRDLPRQSLLIAFSVKILARVLDRCVFCIFAIQKKPANKDLFLKCLETLIQDEDGLRRNNCNLKDDTSTTYSTSLCEIEKRLPTFNAYACEYWVQHLHDSDYDNETLAIREEHHQLIYTFLSKHLLHWIEVMSLLRKTFMAISSLLLLKLIISSNDELCNLVCDAEHFLLAHRSYIKSYPLQLYSSAFLFRHENSLICSKFEDAIPNWITRQATMNPNWSPLLHKLDYRGPLWSISVSCEPHNYLLSWASYIYILIWELLTGECLEEINFKSKVDFSRASQMLLEFSDKKIVIQSASTGEVLEKIEDDSASPGLMVFSTDSKLVAFQSLDGTVKVWDAIKGRVVAIFQPLSELGRLCFSHDASTLAMVTRTPCIIEIRDIQTGECFQTLEHQDGHFMSDILFSQDSKTLVSTTCDNGFNIWDIQTGTRLRTINTGGAGPAAFSSHLRRLPYRDGSDVQAFIKLWDVESRCSLKAVRGNMGSEFIWVLSNNDDQRPLTMSNTTVDIWGLINEILSPDDIHVAIEVIEALERVIEGLEDDNIGGPVKEKSKMRRLELLRFTLASRCNWMYYLEKIHYMVI